jgi:hypothetical protein
MVSQVAQHTPGFSATTPPSVIRRADSIPHEILVARLAVPAPLRTSLAPRLIASLRAATTTPVEPSDAYLTHFSGGIGLPVIMASRLPQRHFEACSMFIRICGPQSLLTSFEAVSNRCENAIRPFVVGRKAWLFSDTAAGAHASTVIYSLVQTAKANGLEPYFWLRRVLRDLPAAKTGEEVAALLPWNLHRTDLTS